MCLCAHGKSMCVYECVDNISHASSYGILIVTIVRHRIMTTMSEAITVVDSAVHTTSGNVEVHMLSLSNGHLGNWEDKRSYRFGPSDESAHQRRTSSGSSTYHLEADPILCNNDDNKSSRTFTSAFSAFLCFPLSSREESSRPD